MQIDYGLFGCKSREAYFQRFGSNYCISDCCVMNIYESSPSFLSPSLSIYLVFSLGPENPQKWKSNDHLSVWQFYPITMQH